MSGKPEGQTDDDLEFEIEIIDDTPDQDKGRPRRPEGAAPEIPEDDDLENYSEGVKKRISKLKYEFHEERRRGEEAVRLRDEAVAYAKRQHDETTSLRKRLEQGDTALLTQAQQRIKIQGEQIKARMKTAYEAGDTDAYITASSDLVDLKAEEHRVSAYKPQPAPQQAAPAPAPAPRPQVKPPSQQAQTWATKNEWFGKDEDMTALAFGVHERVVRQGVAPDSEAYYTAIDAAVKQRFPEKFAALEESAPKRQASSVVAPAGRSTAAAPRKVTLTASQASLAKRLGLSNAQYAAQLIKEQDNG
jgi:hypothetical protein